MKALEKEPVGVPGREIGALLPSCGGPTGESTAKALRVWPVEVRGTPVFIDKLDGIAGLPGEGKGENGEGESVARRLGSRTVWRKESVCKGVRLTFGSAGGGVKVIEGGKELEVGMNGAAETLSADALREVANGGGGVNVRVSDSGSLSCSPNDSERGTASASDGRTGFVRLAEGTGEGARNEEGGAAAGFEGSLVLAVGKALTAGELTAGETPKTGPPKTLLEPLPNMFVVAVPPKLDGVDCEPISLPKTDSLTLTGAVFAVAAKEEDEARFMKLEKQLFVKYRLSYQTLGPYSGVEWAQHQNYPIAIALHRASAVMILVLRSLALRAQERPPGNLIVHRYRQGMSQILRRPSHPASSHPYQHPFQRLRLRLLPPHMPLVNHRELNCH